MNSRRAVDWRLCSHRMDKRDVVNAFCQMREQLADPFAALAILVKLPARLNNSALILAAAAAKCFDFDCFSIHPDHRRLVVKRVDVAWSAIHEQEDDALCFGRELW